MKRTGLGLTMVLILFGCACSAPAEPGNDGSDSTDALTHSQAAAAYEGAELITERIPASDLQRPLGVASWSAYYAAKGSFVGAVLFASDSKGEVRYVVMVNGAAASTGKIVSTAMGLTPDGHPLAVGKDVHATLLKDLPLIQAAIRTADSYRAESSGIKCYKAVGIAITSIIGAATVGVAGWLASVPAAMAVEFSSVLSRFPFLARTLGDWVLSGTLLSAAVVEVSGGGVALGATISGAIECTR